MASRSRLRWEVLLATAFAEARHGPSVGTMAFERITTDPDRMGGVPCIRDLRFPVATVVAMVADGMTVDEILAEHPDLEAEDVTESLRHAAVVCEAVESGIS